jgi:hypothetical protein
LISVKTERSGELPDYADAIRLIVTDIEANPGRELNSVVMTAMNFDDGLTLEKIRLDLRSQMYLKPFRALLNMGVPVVLTAGNRATNSGSQMIDEYPAVAQDQDTPFINVGASTYDGDRAEFSQYGSQLTIYAPGQDVECQTKEDGKSGTDSGTSLGKFRPSLLIPDLH